MQRTIRFSLPILVLAAAALLSSGCRSKPNDAELTKNVQSKIGADTALQGQPISAVAKDGTVTLTGTVSAASSRQLASRDASSVSGVRTVVNDLTIAAAEAPAPGNPATGEPAPPPPGPAGQQTENIAPPPPVPAAPQTLVIPRGTRFRVSLGRTLSSNHSRTGEPFSGTLVSAVRINGQTVIRAGARAEGTVTEAQKMGRFKGKAVLALRLERLRVDGRTYPVRTSHIDRVEQGKGKRSAIMTGGGAGLGAIIGGLAGGGKGALIGGLVGGGGGAAGSAFTGNKDIVLPAETVLTFHLERSVTVR